MDSAFFFRTRLIRTMSIFSAALSLPDIEHLVVTRIEVSVNVVVGISLGIHIGICYERRSGLLNTAHDDHFYQELTRFAFFAACDSAR